MSCFVATFTPTQFKARCEQR